MSVIRQAAMANLVLPVRRTYLDSGLVAEDRVRLYAYGGNVPSGNEMVLQGRLVAQFPDGSLLRSERPASAHFDGLQARLSYEAVFGRPSAPLRTVRVTVEIDDDADQVRFYGHDAASNQLLWDSNWYRGGYWSLYVLQHTR